MSEIVQWIDAPLVAGMMMFGVADAIEHRIAQPDVWRGHVDFRAERPCAIGELAVFHSRKEIKIFFDAALAIRAFLAGPIGRAAILIGLFGSQIVNVGEALFDE